MNDMTNFFAHAYSSPSSMTPDLEALMGQDMASRFGKYHAPAKPAARPVSPANAVAIRASNAERTRPTRAAALAALTGPLTSCDVSRKVGITDSHARNVLSAMLDDGLVSVVTVKRTRIWSRVEVV